jgi:endonuclease I
MRLLPVLFFLSSFSFSQIPAGYYDLAMGLSGVMLKEALNDIIQNHVEFPYTSSNTDTWDILKETDRDTLNSDNVILLYSGWSVDAAQEYNNGNGYNREHVWPQSRGPYNTSMGVGTDVHALRPTDISVNSARNNRWFAECDEEYIDNDGPTGSFMSNSDYVWKPRDEVKGDVARMMFYMAVRYEGENGELDLELIDSIPSDNNLSLPLMAKISDLLIWNEQDPVSEWERNRNDIIFYNYQENRNPFIDNPEWAQEIWGSTSGISEFDSKDKKLMRILDITGREIEYTPNQVMIYQFSDGTSKRVFVLD